MSESRRRSRTFALAWLIAGLQLMAACALPPPRAAQDAARPPIELQLADPRGQPLSLARFAGRPLLIFLFSTSDTGSQLALTHIEHWLLRRHSMDVLGIALQPDAKLFLTPYRDALSVSFPLSYDPQDVILSGHSDLGRVEAVPALIVLDAQGSERGRRYGVLDEAELQSFVAAALRR
ncbi:MAG TPA: hypothetical protein VF331_18175 [Polyangiales bacterium]